ncbi:MAG: hypothetical protein AAGB93_19275 [Planctomycetota bacterium]
MSEESPIRVHRLRQDWRVAILFGAAMGVGAISIGAAGLLDLPIDALRDERTSGAELWVALVAGLILVVLARSALRHGRAWCDRSALHVLGLGLPCRTVSLPLDEVVRFGHGSERRGYQNHEVLLLELRGGERRGIKVSMYEDWRELVDEIGRCTGLERSPTKDSIAGVRFVENGENER